MKDLFHLDNPFIQFLARVGDLILANVLFLVCSLPVITLGASLTALHRVTQGIAGEREAGVWKTFFRAFRGNVRQATFAWLALLVFFVGMGLNFLLADTYLSGIMALVCKCLLGAVVVIVLAVAAYLFPLLARYENTLKEHVANAGILAVVKLPRTIGMVLLDLLPVLILYFSMQTFFRTLVFWLLVGFGFTSYLTSMLLVSVFGELEAPGGPHIQFMK